MKIRLRGYYCKLRSFLLYLVNLDIRRSIKYWITCHCFPERLYAVSWIRCILGMLYPGYNPILDVLYPGYAVTLISCILSMLCPRYILCIVCILCPIYAESVDMLCLGYILCLIYMLCPVDEESCVCCVLYSR